MATGQPVAYFNGFISKRENREITDKDTGEISKFTVYTFAFDCYIKELGALYTHDKLPAEAEIYDAWIPSRDVKQNQVLSALKDGQKGQFATLPGGKGGGKRGASGLRLQFLSARPL